ncbi:hypothetical protein [Marinibacterium profundimaris]|uniref:hypothetical protein n=1 Tax=Marinibacterium profundimaris TaxID=1679460 RepID=UPI000B522632|nr:hypothetical protein [Marinibacterium profundimaris]
MPASDSDFPHGKAAALLAYALDIDRPGTLGSAMRDRLVDEVCEDATERTRLISLMSTSQDRHLQHVVLELLSTRLDRLKDALEAAEDTDEIYGKWLQRTSAGAILASLGFVVTDVVGGAWAALAICASLLAGSGATGSREVVRRRARKARRAVEQTERLIDTLRGFRPQGE